MKCLQAARLLSKQQDHPLAPREQAALCLHLLSCSACRNFRLQLRVLRQASRNYRQSPQSSP